MISWIGAPKGTVLYNSESCHLQFSYDCAVVAGIRVGQELEYRELGGNFVEWCSRNHLLLIVNKTKEMVVND